MSTQLARKPTPKPKTDFGGGLSVSRNAIDHHPAGPPRHGELGQAERAFTLASTFLSGVLAISASQFIGAPLKLIDPAFYDAYMAYTKESFAVLITSLTQWWAPTVVRVSGDDSMKGQLIQTKDGSLKCNFSERLVLMANHQLYTDWLYLWWIAYTNSMHGRIYIILKESLKNIPVLGWSAQFYNFIFLSRNWEKDKPRFQAALKHLKKATDPMWLLIFPEGTNLSATTRQTSKAWAEKSGLQDMKHQLLPRSTGLRFCLQELKDTTNWLYDCTIAYEGVPPGQFGQDIFTLRSSFFEGRPPKSVNMHWRRFKIADIPIDSPKAFEVWLRNRWREKDYMLEHFTRHARFPADSYWKEQLADVSDKSSTTSSIRTVPRPARIIETEVKSGRFEEFLRIFAPITGLAMALFLAYGASPEDLPFPNGAEFLQQHLGNLIGAGGIPGSIGDVDKMLQDGPGLPSQPKIPPLGNTPADKEKQRRYLELFKNSLPPDISKDAERRYRQASSFVKEQKQKQAVKQAQNPASVKKQATTVNGSAAAKGRPIQAANKAAKPVGATKPATANRTPLGTVKYPPLPQKAAGATKAAAGTTTGKAPMSVPSRKADVPQRTALVNGVRVPISGGPADSPAAAQNKPRTAKINGVTVQISDAPTRKTVPPTTSSSSAAAASQRTALGTKLTPTAEKLARAGGPVTGKPAMKKAVAESVRPPTVRKAPSVVSSARSAAPRKLGNAGSVAGGKS